MGRRVPRGDFCKPHACLAAKRAPWSSRATDAQGAAGDTGGRWRSGKECDTSCHKYLWPCGSLYVRVSYLVGLCERYIYGGYSYEVLLLCMINFLFAWPISIANPHDSTSWDKMAAIKSNILKRWDTASTGVRTCCIKFVQKVVHVQTPGVIADPRVRTVLRPLGAKHTNTNQRPEQNEISLALVPRDHPLIPPMNLEPEASGLLDRLLNVFYEDRR